MVYYEHIRLDKELLVKRAVTRFEEHDIHYHDWLEICIIVENEARYRFNDAEFVGKPGDLFICRPFEAHWIFSKEPDRPCSWIYVLFSPSVLRYVPGGQDLLSPFYMDRTLSAWIPGGSTHARAISAAAERAVAVQEGAVAAWETKQFNYFLGILLELYDYTVDNLRNAGIGVMDNGMIRAIGYILSHITEEIDMNEAIALSGLGKTLFYRKFRQLTQASPNHFINRLRLQIAAQSLLHTDKSVTALAMESGYSTLSAFNKQFVHHFGVSPRTYRKHKSLT